MEEYTQEIINEQIKNALEKVFSPETIVDVLDVSLERVLEIQSNHCEKSMVQ